MGQSHGLAYSGQPARVERVSHSNNVLMTNSIGQSGGMYIPGGYNNVNMLGSRNASTGILHAPVAGTNTWQGQTSGRSPLTY